jgi:hypothetical protein
VGKDQVLDRSKSLEEGENKDTESSCKLETQRNSEEAQRNTKVRKKFLNR